MPLGYSPVMVKVQVRQRGFAEKSGSVPASLGPSLNRRKQENKTKIRHGRHFTRQLTANEIFGKYEVAKTCHQTNSAGDLAVEFIVICVKVGERRKSSNLCWESTSKL